MKREPSAADLREAYGHTRSDDPTPIEVFCWRSGRADVEARTYTDADVKRLAAEWAVDCNMIGHVDSWGKLAEKYQDKARGETLLFLARLGFTPAQDSRSTAVPGELDRVAPSGAESGRYCECGVTRYVTVANPAICTRCGLPERLPSGSGDPAPLAPQPVSGSTPEAVSTVAGSSPVASQGAGELGVDPAALGEREERPAIHIPGGRDAYQARVVGLLESIDKRLARFEAERNARSEP